MINVEGGKEICPVLSERVSPSSFVSRQILVMNSIGTFRSTSSLGVIGTHPHQNLIIFSKFFFKSYFPCTVSEDGANNCTKAGTTPHGKKMDVVPKQYQ